VFLHYNTNGFAHHRLDDAVSLLADLGYDGIALTPDVHHLDPYRASATEIDAFRARLERLNLGVTIEGGARFVLDPGRKHWPTLLSPRGAFERRQDFYVRLIDLAERVGAPLVSIWSGASEDVTASLDAQLDVLAERLRPVLDHAKTRNVALTFEPEPGMLIDTLAMYARLKQRVPSLPLTIDTGHLAASETEPYGAHIEAHAKDLLYVQIDDAPKGRHEHLFFGEGVLDFGDIAHALNTIDYRGVVAVELSRHSHDAVNTARRAAEFLRKHDHA
jgi:L-ribulose-5-phosphate 3-epimerase